MTFMVYLNDVDAGGRTIFPQTGVSVQPEIGSALYWFLMGSQNSYDSRVVHMGCPVSYGNKWIANKWTKWLSNFKTYPCSTEHEHYSIQKRSAFVHQSDELQVPVQYAPVH